MTDRLPELEEMKIGKHPLAVSDFVTKGSVRARERYVIKRLKEAKQANTTLRLNNLIEELEGKE